MKIQINSLAALERLIGGDNELEIEIRNSIVQEFAKKHLKAVANTNIFEKTKKELFESIRKYVDENFSKEIASFESGYYGIANVRIKPEIAEKIKSLVRDTSDKQVREAVETALEKWSKDKQIEFLVKSRVDFYTKEIIDNEIKKKLDDLKKSL